MPDTNNKLDIDKLFNEYIVNEFNKLIDIVFEYDKLDNVDKLHYLIDLGYHDNDSGAKDTGNGDNNNGVTHIDSPSYDDLDGLVGNNPYNH